MRASEMQDKYGIADAVRFEKAPGGLDRAVIAGPLAEGSLYLNGAHVAGWTPRGQRPVLFLSSRSAFEAGKPIRGGVPICFPWFGPRGGGAAGPLHGFARIQDWTVDGTELLPDGAVALSLSLAANDFSRGFDYDAFGLRFRVVFGATLSMELEVRNSAATPLWVEEALHAYFAIGDIEQVSVTGLEGTTYVDKTDAFKRKQQPTEALRIANETDQVHLNTRAACTIHDPAWNRRITVEKEGSNATVVWNPWIAKTKTIGDLAPEDWREMICVETVNAMENAVTVAPGAAHILKALICVG